MFLFFVFVGLGKVFGVLFDFLMSGQVVELLGVEFWKYFVILVRDCVYVEVFVIEKLEDYFDIEDIFGFEKFVDLFVEVWCDVVGLFDEIEYKVRELCWKWEFGNDLILSIIDFFERKGVKVIEVDFLEWFDGLVCVVKCIGGKLDIEVVVILSWINIECKWFNFVYEFVYCVIKDVVGLVNMKFEKVMYCFVGVFFVFVDYL